MNDDDLSHESAVDWIVERYQLDPRLVDAVLWVKWELMVGTGIVSEELVSPDGDVFAIEARLCWDWQFYEPGELDGVAPIVDDERIAQDAQRLAGVPLYVALKVLEAEWEFLELHGLA